MNVSQTTLEELEKREKELWAKMQELEELKAPIRSEWFSVRGEIQTARLAAKIRIELMQEKLMQEMKAK